MRVPSLMVKLMSTTVIVCAMAFAVGPLSAQEGTVVGQVTEAGTLRPLESVQVSVTAMSLGGLSNAAGQFVLVGIPAGTHVLEARYLGYALETRDITVTAGETVVVNVELQSQAIALDELIVTGTGVVTERRRLGQTVATVGADALLESGAASVTEALQGRVSGLSPSPSRRMGNSSFIVLRGGASISQRNEPIIYVDGVRMDNTRSQSWSNLISPIDEINPADIERIEVIKGAAAATLYGTEASAGVIQIITKRGSAGTPVYTVEIGQEMTSSPNSRIQSNFGYDFNTGEILEDRPFDRFVGTGYVQNYAVSARGGTQTVQYFASARLNDERGKMRTDINKSELRSGRLDITFKPTPKLETRAGLSIASRLLRVPAGRTNFVWPTILANPALKDENRPYGELFGFVRDFERPDGSPASINDLESDHLTVSAAAAYEWTPSIRSEVIVGYDQIAEQQVFMVPAGFAPTNADGVRLVSTEDRTATTVDFKTSWNRNFGSNISSTFLVGGQSFWQDRWFREVGIRNFASSELRTLRGGSTVSAVDEWFEEVINAGAYAQEQIGLGDKLFLTGGVRIDGNSAFGDDFGFEVYPKAGVSWVVSDYDFWNFGTWDQLRIRGALGTSGMQPNAFDALQTWQPAALINNSPSVIPGNLGNSELKPERSIEREIAAEFGFAGGRVGLELVYYNQVTKDALLQAPASPSLGFLNTQLTNLGEITKQGIETSLNVTWIQRPDLTWRTNFQFSWNDQTVTDLGGLAPFRITGARRWHTIREGFTPGAWIGPTRDTNNPYNIAVPVDQLTSLSQITPNVLKNAAGSDSLAFVGNPLPNVIGSFATSLDLPRGFSLNAMFSGAAGFIISRETTLIRESMQITERVANFARILDDPSSSTEERQRVAEEYGGQHHRVISNWAQDGDFIRFQELSLRYQVPASIVQALRANSLQLTLSGRDLAVWTKEYVGIGDPLSGGGLWTSARGRTGAIFLQNIEWDNLPTPRRFGLTVRATF